MTYGSRRQLRRRRPTRPSVSPPRHLLQYPELLEARLVSDASAVSLLDYTPSVFTDPHARPAASQPLAVREAEGATQSQLLQIVFVDPAIEDYDALIDQIEIPSSISLDVVLLDAGADGDQADRRIPVRAKKH